MFNSIAACVEVKPARSCGPAGGILSTLVATGNAAAATAASAGPLVFHREPLFLYDPGTRSRGDHRYACGPALPGADTVARAASRRRRCRHAGWRPGWPAAAVRQQIESQLRHVAATLGGATFPLTSKVLEQVKELSGADYVLYRADGWS